MRFSMVQWKEHRFGLLHDKDICLTLILISYVIFDKELALLKPKKKKNTTIVTFMAEEMLLDYVFKVPCTQ